MKGSCHLIACLAVVFAAGLIAPRDARADISLSQRGCQAYATWSGNLVWARDLGANKEKAKAELVALDQKTPQNMYELMLRNFEKLWTTSADWESVMVVVLKDCINRRGVYETGT